MEYIYYSYYLLVVNITNNALILVNSIKIIGEGRGDIKDNIYK